MSSVRLLLWNGFRVPFLGFKISDRQREKLTLSHIDPSYSSLSSLLTRVLNCFSLLYPSTYKHQNKPHSSHSAHRESLTKRTSLHVPRRPHWSEYSRLSFLVDRRKGSKIPWLRSGVRKPMNGTGVSQHICATCGRSRHRYRVCWEFGNFGKSLESDKACSVSTRKCVS